MTRKYAVKEVFYTVQGEGSHAGTPMVFCRFSGCNVWSGREQDRERDAEKGVCARWCDTDFVGTDGENGGVYAAQDLVSKILDVGGKCRRVVFTGGEPSLQVDADLVSSCHRALIWSAVETNGSKNLPAGLDWVCLSPKPFMAVVRRIYDEVKVVYPAINPLPWISYAREFFVQPQDGDPEALGKCIDFVKENPEWRISLQTHKLMGVR